MSYRPLPPGPDAPLSLDEIRGDRLEFLARMKRGYGSAVRYFTEDWQAVFVSLACRPRAPKRGRRARR